jgi:hypothetical protein
LRFLTARDNLTSGLHRRSYTWCSYVRPDYQLEQAGLMDERLQSMRQSTFAFEPRLSSSAASSATNAAEPGCCRSGQSGCRHVFERAAGRVGVLRDAGHGTLWGKLGRSAKP